MDKQSLDFGRQFVENLIVARTFGLAFQIWRSLPEGAKAVKGQIANGDFKDPVESHIGFQWQIVDNLKQAKLLLDSRTPNAGGMSLRIDYAAEGRQDFNHIHQLVLVEPN